MKDKVTLRPGDYVSTKGLTEADYHAVARAFMAAAAESGEYPDSDLDLWEYFGWNDSRDALEFWDKPQAFGDDSRHLTPQQVVSATNAGGKTMTPCEKLGYKVGDRFVAKSNSMNFSEGSIARFTGKYGIFGNPLMELVSGSCMHNNAPGGKAGAYEPIERFEKIGAEESLTTILEQAAEHDATSKHHAAMHERLMAEAREMLPEGWRLVRAEDMAGSVSVDVGEWMKGSFAPTQDMSNPENWRAGDVVECVKDDWFTCERFRVGQTYNVSEPLTERKFIRAIDDDNDLMFAPADHFRFHHRP